MGPESNGTRPPAGGGLPEDEGPGACLGFCSKENPADLGELIVVLLTSTLAGLRDRLFQDGFERAAELVGDLVEVADDYLSRLSE